MLAGGRTPTRRRLLGAAAVVGAVGAVGGIGVGLWRYRLDPQPPRVDIWSLRFATPQGGDLVLAELRGRALLVNFWATWCPPCVTEMPLLDRFQRAQPPGGWQVVGLAIDSEQAVREFLARQPVGFSIGLAGAAGLDLVRNLGNPGGGLPFTLAFDAAGKALKPKLGALDEADLRRWSGH